LTFRLAGLYQDIFLHRSELALQDGRLAQFECAATGTVTICARQQATLGVGHARNGECERERRGGRNGGTDWGVDGGGKGGEARRGPNRRGQKQTKKNKKKQKKIKKKKKKKKKTQTKKGAGAGGTDGAQQKMRKNNAVGMLFAGDCCKAERKLFRKTKRCYVKVEPARV